MPINIIRPYVAMLYPNILMYGNIYPPKSILISIEISYAIKRGKQIICLPFPYDFKYLNK